MMSAAITTSTTTEQTTRISVGTVVFKGNQILFGRAKDKDGKTKYILPVGHLEFMESFTKCAKRELMEECGIEIEDVELQFVSNTDHYKGKHYVHIGLTAKWKSGEPEVLEEGALDAWEWRDRDDLPDYEQLSAGAAVTVKAMEEGGRMYEEFEAPSR